MNLSGIYTALTTPFAGDGSVDPHAIRHNIARYNDCDLAGYLALGSTGESVLLSRSEMDVVLATVKEAAATGRRLLAGTGAESTAETIERTKRAAEFGYDIALVKTPYYYKPVYKPDLLIAHYRRVADASPIPVMLYSVPQLTGITLEAPEIAVLSEHPNIIGIKDSSGHVQRAAETVDSAQASFQVLVGSAANIVPSLAVGARGCILALACALPERCAAVFRAYESGDLKNAQKLQRALIGVSKLIVSQMGIAGVKYAMDLRGYRGGVPRLPLLPLTEESKRRIAELVGTLEPATAHA